MKRILLLSYFTFSILNSAFSQVGMWTWMKGNTAVNFGTLGVPALTNEPLDVYEGCEWVDNAGNFWVFGSSWNATNTLWRYEPATNNWTWMNGSQLNGDPGNAGTMGVSSPLNQPKGRGFGCLSWVDLSGNLWMFGGSTAPSTNNNDMWKYDIITNEWTWMSGSQAAYVAPTYGTMGVPNASNFPGGRYESNATWTDANGIFWMFGGGFFDGTGALHARNDMWTYDPATNIWTWVNGPNTVDDLGNYGTQGVPAPTNFPPARSCYTKFQARDGTMWIFGGGSWQLANTALNDLWKYDPLTNMWTWVSGPQSGLSGPTYSTVCVMDSLAIPAPRYEDRACWTDAQGNFWLFAGNTNSGNFNDLWKYCPSGNKWSFIKGSTTSGATSVYGTQGVPAPANDPGARNGSHSYFDGIDKLFLFSGANGVNDLWMFQIDPACAQCVATIPPGALFNAPDTMICPGTCIGFNNLSQNATSYQWLFPGATPASDTATNPTGICYGTSGTYNVTLTASNSGGLNTYSITNYITVYPAATPPTISQVGDTLFSTSGYVSYQWFYGSDSIPGATNYYVVAALDGNYNLIVTDENGCSVGVGILNVVTDLAPSPAGEGWGEVYPNPARDEITITLPSTSGKNSVINAIEIYNSIGQKVYAVTPVTLSEVEGGVEAHKEIKVSCKEFSSGIYLLSVHTATGVICREFVVRK